MMRSHTNKIHHKGSTWKLHGKNAKVDPWYYRRAKIARDIEWFSSIRELFAVTRRI